MGGGPIDDVMLNPQALVYLKILQEIVSMPISYPGIANTFALYGNCHKDQKYILILFKIHVQHLMR